MSSNHHFMLATKPLRATITDKSLSKFPVNLQSPLESTYIYRYIHMVVKQWLCYAHYKITSCISGMFMYPSG